MSQDGKKLEASFVIYSEPLLPFMKPGKVDIQTTLTLRQTEEGQKIAVQEDVVLSPLAKQVQKLHQLPGVGQVYQAVFMRTASLLVHWLVVVIVALRSFAGYE